MSVRYCFYLMLLLASGCLPVPTPPHGIGIVLDEETFESLQPGRANRADVLLTLGKPHHRLSDDRYLIYEWDIAYGYAIVGEYTQAYPIPVTAPHYLCLEFSEDGQLVRRETLTGGLYAKPDKAIERCKNPEKPSR